jgi:hypothetical protein
MSRCHDVSPCSWLVNADWRRHDNLEQQGMTAGCRDITMILQNKLKWPPFCSDNYELKGSIEIMILYREGQMQKTSAPDTY